MHGEENSPPSKVTGPPDAAQPASPVSPYTRGLAECLHTLEQSERAEGRDERTLHHLLCNLLQGRILEHLRQQLVEHYQLDPEDLGERVSLLLIDVFKEEIFGNFRRRIEARPELLSEIAREIVSTETGSATGLKARIRELYQRIFQEHLGYANLDAILRILQADGRLQNLIVASMLRKTRIRPPAVSFGCAPKFSPLPR